jgi:hypothetical protein
VSVSCSMMSILSDGFQLSFLSAIFFGKDFYRMLMAFKDFKMTR